LLVLSAADLSALVEIPALIAALERGFAAYSAGNVQQPLRVSLDLEQRGGLMLVMPAAVESIHAVGVKVVTVYPGNRAVGLPTIHATYLLVDPADGSVLALLDGTYLTGIRTACASAVATHYLARPDSEVLLIFGTGVQAVHHLRAMPAVLPRLREVWVCGRTMARAEEFVAAHAAPHGIRLQAVPPARSVLAEADVIVTATTAKEPLFPGEWLRPGMHINAVGAFQPTHRELDAVAVSRAVRYVDTRAGAEVEAGDLLMAVAEGVLGPGQLGHELGEVILGRVQGRTSREEITLFKSVGAAFEDAVVAQYFYQRARRGGIGQSVHL